jgi:hypothetical protein
VHERAVAWIAAQLDVADEDYQRDVSLTTAEVCHEVGWLSRTAELLSLVGLALRLRSRASTRDRPEAIWSQGVHTGALVLLAGLGAQCAADGSAGQLAIAFGLVAAVVLALGGRRRAAIACIVAATTIECLMLAHGAGGGAFASGGLIVIGGLLARSSSATRPRHTAAAVLAAIAAVLLSTAVAAALGTATAHAAVVVAFGWLLPIALVSLGWFDPRLAAAATTLVFARLAASGFGELGHALAALDLGGQRYLLARWVLMGTAVLAAWLVTDRSIRRVTRL